MEIRKCRMEDLDEVERLYDRIHDAEESGNQVTGWLRDVYPVRGTAEAAVKRGDLYVLEDEASIKGAAIINKVQVDCYADGKWEHAAADDQICVIHTLVILPSEKGKGYGKAFIDFYEEYARKAGCTELRLDTNARNKAARAMYSKLGYKEIDVVPTVFNGIPGVNLVLLEKYIG